MTNKPRRRPARDWLVSLGAVSPERALYEAFFLSALCAATLCQTAQATDRQYSDQHYSAQQYPERDFIEQPLPGSELNDRPIAAFMTKVAQTHKDLLKGVKVALPHYNVDELCAHQTQIATPSYNACIANNQSAYDYLKSSWSRHYSDARSACVRQTQQAASKGYDVLEQCLDALEETKKESP